MESAEVEELKKESGIFRKLNKRFDQTDEATIKQLILYLCFFSAIFIFFEVVFHLFAYGELGNRIYVPIVFAIFWGVLIASCTMLFRPKGRVIFGTIVILTVWAFFVTQLVYFHIFGANLSLSQFGMGTDAVTSFWRETLAAIGDIWYQIAILLLPLFEETLMLSYFPS